MGNWFCLRFTETLENVRRQGEDIVLPLLIIVGYLTAKSQSVHLSEGI